MLDIRLIRENPGLVKSNLSRRNNPELTKLVDLVIKHDLSRRELIQKLDLLRKRRNEITKEVAELKSKGVFVRKQINEAKKLPEEIKDLEKKLERENSKCSQILMSLPNMLHESVPYGKDDNENQEIFIWGEKAEFGFEPKDHIDLALDLDLVDLEQAADISGARFYYLKNELVLLNHSILRFVMDHLVKKDFIPIQPPFMIRRKPYEGVTDLADFESVLYKIQDEDLYLIATSEHPMAALYMGKTIDETKLPLKLAGISPCFRKEAGAHGKDTKGIFRVHQFDKIEQFIFCQPEQSWQIHEDLRKNTEEIFRAFEIPYRIVDICTGDIGTVAAKKYDLEAWLPAQRKYREMASCSNCTDYQARRLGVKYGKKDQPATGLVHTLNNTGIASPRILVAILENFQQEDGSINIPKALWPYTGFKKIEKKA